MLSYINFITSYSLINKNLIDCTNNIIIDSKSGYSGAGKKFDLKISKKFKWFKFL